MNSIFVVKIDDRQESITQDLDVLKYLAKCWIYCMKGSVLIYPLFEQAPMVAVRDDRQALASFVCV